MPRKLSSSLSFQPVVDVTAQSVATAQGPIVECGISSGSTGLEQIPSASRRIKASVSDDSQHDLSELAPTAKGEATFNYFLIMLVVVN